jgi:haloalkane dehalogenase
VKLFVERWRVLNSWKGLPAPAREQWIGEIGPAIEAIVARGVEYVCGALMDSDAGDEEFVAVWRVPDEEAQDAFRRAIADSGWYEYFEQVNLSGSSLELSELIGSLVGY